MAGLTEQGFSGKTLEEIVDEILADMARDLGTTPDKLGKVWRRLALANARGHHRVWQLLQGVVDFSQPRNTSEVLLDHLADMAGLTREGSRRTRIQLTTSGTLGTFLEDGNLVRRDGTEDDFALVDEHTISALAVDNAVFFEAVEPGALVINPEDTFSIQTAVSGWESVSSLVQVTDGRGREPDEELHLRREQALSAPIAAHEASIRRELLKHDAVEEAMVFSNRSGDASPDTGINPHAIAVFIYPLGLGDEDEQRIAETIFKAASGGVELQGTERFEVTDEQGYKQTVGWSYVAIASVRIKVVYTKAQARFPLDGEAKIEAALAAEIESYGIATEVTLVLIEQLEAAARCAAPGILTLNLYISPVGEPTEADTNDLNLSFGSRMVLQSVDVEEAEEAE